MIFQWWCSECSITGFYAFQIWNTSFFLKNSWTFIIRWFQVFGRVLYKPSSFICKHFLVIEFRIMNNSSFNVRKWSILWILKSDRSTSISWYSQLFIFKYPKKLTILHFCTQNKLPKFSGLKISGPTNHTQQVVNIRRSMWQNTCSQNNIHLMSTIILFLAA